MIKVENIYVSNIDNAIRGMRNPLNSWDRIDSFTEIVSSTETYIDEYISGTDYPIKRVLRKFDDKNASKSQRVYKYEVFNLGENDLSLMRKLYQGGTEHRKYMRQIFVSMDITAPTYWFSEFDTYKIGVTRNSCSFMHKGVAKPFELSDFSIYPNTEGFSSKYWNDTIDRLNKLRTVYLETKNPDVFEELRAELPSGYNIKATLTMSYENVINMINQRSNHRLKEWRDFCSLMTELPYIREITECQDLT